MLSQVAFDWIMDTLGVTYSAARILQRVWVEGYSTTAAGREFNKSRPAVAMCSGRHLRKAELRAKRAVEAAAQLAELKQQQAALQIAESAGEADELDRARVQELETACTEEIRALAAEAILWEQFFLGDPPVDHEENPDALPPPLELPEHAGAINSSMRGPRKQLPNTPEYDANGRRVGAPAVLVTRWETEQLCKQVRCRKDVTREFPCLPM